MSRLCEWRRVKSTVVHDSRRNFAPARTPSTSPCASPLTKAKAGPSTENCAAVTRHERVSPPRGGTNRSDTKHRPKPQSIAGRWHHSLASRPPSDGHVPSARPFGMSGPSLSRLQSNIQVYRHRRAAIQTAARPGWASSLFSPTPPPTFLQTIPYSRTTHRRCTPGNEGCTQMECRGEADQNVGGCFILGFRRRG